MPQADNPVAFPELDDAQIASLSRFAKLRSFGDGETLLVAGDSDFKFFVVKRGEVEITERSSGQRAPVRKSKITWTFQPVFPAAIWPAAR